MKFNLDLDFIEVFIHALCGQVEKFQLDPGAAAGDLSVKINSRFLLH